MFACSPSTLSEWRVEGVSLVKSLVEELQKVKSSDDLKVASKSIKKKYSKLVEIMLEADSYPQEEGAFHPESFYSDALKGEYIRLYKIEGCKELLFLMQKESLHKLDRATSKF